MFQSPAQIISRIDARWPNGRRRAASIGLALALELLLLLALLTLGSRRAGEAPQGQVITSFDVRGETAPDPPAPAPAPTPAPQTTATAPQSEQAPPAPAPAAAPPAIVLPRPLTTPAPPEPPVRGPAAPEPTPAKPRITAVIRSDMASVKGPQGAAGMPGDSQRIAGSGPNGEPLYAARWYREPYPDELTGYLDYVNQPAWALINCQTQPEYRVDHCVLVDEWPQGSNMGRAVLAAAWQFKVRPPRVGGRVMVGEWVRIRINYTIRRK